MAAGAAAGADVREFCCSSPSAVMVTVWPTAFSQKDAVRQWLSDCGAEIKHESEIRLTQRAGVPACLALYFGEDWLHSNCWYTESPLPEGPPEGPYAGAKWKAALTFRDSTPDPMAVFVVDAAATDGELWHTKYRVREKLRKAVGALGNACIHVTDDQTAALGAWRRDDSGSDGGGGYSCDSSYAFHCARVLLEPSSVAFLNGADIHSRDFDEQFERFAAWLSSPPGSPDAEQPFI